MRQVIGVDIGGTGIKGLVVDEAGTVLAEAARDTDARLGREAILGKLRELVDELRAGGTSAEAVGIATAGRVNVNTGEVVYATDNLPGWQGMQLTEWAAAELGLPAAADNDANAALLGEAWLGVGRGKRDQVMLTLGTGVGGANMAQGLLSRGATWSAGEWGHSVLVPGGRPCNCGRQGCVEQYISGSALVRLAHEMTGRTYNHGRELMADAGKGETAAVQVLERYTSDLARVLANIGVQLDPELIIIGGGVIHDRAIWWPMLTAKLQGEAGLDERIAAAELGNRAGCFGAAKLALTWLQQQR
ncbi:transcriptional regulator [Paenibacillus donghaensis]|uniref:Transcriptional regulator n=1 Tax=Paenibacillus donghaensis TaxID=414771 RepID=A0A2Z2KV93_9BACL|nr:transcriptional regulator [Paenibacillus donghaensis]